MRSSLDFGSEFAAALTLMTTLALVPACSDEPPFAIVHNLRATSATCGLDSSAVPIASGTFDVAVGDRSAYRLTPLVRNDTDARLTVQTVRLTTEYFNEGEWQRIRIACELGMTCEEWELSTCDADDPSDCPAIPAGGTATFEVPILARLVTTYFRSLMDSAAIEGRRPPEFEMRAHVTLIATRADGTEIESAEFVYPLTMCLGCLVEFPPASDSSLPGPDCCGLNAPLPSCQSGQDDPIDCRRCAISAPEICNFGRLSCD